MTKQLSDLENWKKQEIYKLKCEHEMKGRKMMKKRAIKLALENVDQNDPA